MVNRNLLRQFDLSEEDLEQQLAESMGIESYDPVHPFMTFDNNCSHDTRL